MAQELRTLLWVTDPHLDLFTEEAPKVFAESLKQEYPEAQGVVITGDIATGPLFQKVLENFQEGFQKPVYFVLGNHDFYGVSRKEAKVSAYTVKEGCFWLTSCAPVQLTSDIVLTGHDGWYEGRNGKTSPVRLRDFSEIPEFRGLTHDQRISYCEDIVQRVCVQAKTQILKALDLKPKRLIFATHVPPFERSAWHMGQVSSPEFLPWFSCPSLGMILAQIASNNEDVFFDVYCGHSHSMGVYKPLDNLQVITGKAVYGAPDSAGVITLVSTPHELRKNTPSFCGLPCRSYKFV